MPPTAARDGQGDVVDLLEGFADPGDALTAWSVAVWTAWIWLVISEVLAGFSAHISSAPRDGLSDRITSSKQDCFAQAIVRSLYKDRRHGGIVLASSRREGRGEESLKAKSLVSPPYTVISWSAKALVVANEKFNVGGYNRDAGAAYSAILLSSWNALATRPRRLSTLRTIARPLGASVL